MQKLKNSVIDAMMKLHMTKAEVDFMLELSHYQDDTGTVYGVYYKDMCQAIKISYETFYVVLRSLEQKQLITYQKDCHGDWDIRILNNDFSRGNYTDGYISTGHDLFYDQVFRAMKANEKLLALQLLKIVGASKRYYVNIENFFQKYCDVLGVAKRTLAVYLHSLKQFFKIAKKEGNYWITAKWTIYKENAPTDLRVLSDYLGRVASRRNRLTYTEKALKDTIFLIKQYRETLKEKTASVFLAAVRESIEKQNNDQKYRSKWERTLNPKFVHKLIIQKLG